MSEAAAVRPQAPGRPHGTGAPPTGTPGAPDRGPERFIARAAAVTAGLTVAGALFGLVRDQLVAGCFGAGGDTDAFLVAWTVPEFASTLLIEDAMALVMVPAFSMALARRADLARRTGPGGDGPQNRLGPDPVGALLARTAPRLTLALAGCAALLAVAAPVVVRTLAPGLADPALAVDCTRLTSVTVFTFGIAGYCSAALRAHRRFVPPAAIYVAYNAGILAMTATLHGRWGVRAAAAGVAVGSLCMVLVQLPTLCKQLPRWPRKPRRLSGPRALLPSAVPGVALPVLAPVALFAVARQAQVLAERNIGSSLPPGAISHLNYAQKVAQVPMVLSLMVCTVTFPLVARAMADGDTDGARRRIERDLTLAGTVVLLGAAYVVALAPSITELLFRRGAFTAGDTAATASVMRVYALGLLGHSLAGALVRPFFSAARPTWFPAAAMGAGLCLTVAAGVLAAPRWGVHGIAAANALGITVTAAMLLHGLRTRLVAVDVRRITAGLARLVLAAAAATAAGWAVSGLPASATAAAAAGAVVVPAAFAAAALAVRAPEVPSLLATVKQRLCHAR
ncbi:lipid II flippase MurJ [Streptomyces meridianus]|uniref:Virulence factor MviN n=1 Tax=Streptomyces meridianus TaxID=2938945 RepID=A0ABT0X949_9ACTN|nr:lipid II flippase MurJ [Streptomyces meridianus]MCM2578237.1 virulence factor MviN [Streptomyces meridianus]